MNVFEIEVQIALAEVHIDYLQDEIDHKEHKLAMIDDYYSHEYMRILFEIVELGINKRRVQQYLEHCEKGLDSLVASAEDISYE